MSTTDSIAIKDDPEPILPRLFAQDVTPEHLGTMLAHNNECLTLASDEGGLIDGLGGRYNKDGAGPNLDLINQCHSMGAVRVDRGSRDPVMLDRPRLALAVSPQPKVLATIKCRGAFRHTGTLARFAYAMPVSMIGFRTGDGDPVPCLVRANYERRIVELQRLPHVDPEQPLEALRLSNEARVAWKSFWQDVETRMQPGKELAELSDWGGKLPGLAARIAAVFHLVENGVEGQAVLISEDTMQRAIALARLLIPHALAAFDAMHRDGAMEAARDILDEIRNRAGDTVKKAEVHQRLKNKYPHAKDLEAGWQVLVDRGYVREKPQETSGMRGRPSLQVQVRPGNY